MASWLQHGMVEVVTKDALRHPSTLMNDGALSISNDIDFGQFDLSKLHDISDSEKGRLSWNAIHSHLNVRPLPLSASTAMRADCVVL